MDARDVQQRIPFGNDKQKSKGKCDSRFPAGMTNKKGTGKCNCNQG